MPEKKKFVVDKVITSLLAAREEVANTKMKKAGYNSFSKFSYFLPEQISTLVGNAAKNNKLFVKYDNDKDEFGNFATLTVTSLEDGSSVVFKQRTEMPEIKATNAAQQMGGMVTFTERYLKMAAFEIVDNSLDFDSDAQYAKKTGKSEGGGNKKNSPAEKKDDKKKIKKEVLTEEHPNWGKVVKFLEKGGKYDSVLIKYDVSESVEKALKSKMPNAEG